jgi:hypothetical protein
MVSIICTSAASVKTSRSGEQGLIFLAGFAKNHDKMQIINHAIDVNSCPAA